MLKKFTTTFYMNLFHNINTDPFRIKTNKKLKQRREEKKRNKLRRSVEETYTGTGKLVLDLDIKMMHISYSKVSL